MPTDDIPTPPSAAPTTRSAPPEAVGHDEHDGPSARRVVPVRPDPGSEPATDTAFHDYEPL